MNEEILKLNNPNNNTSSNIDLLSIINNEDPIDLFSIQADNLLNDVKKMIIKNIGKDLNVEKTNKIDVELKKSLKKVLVVNNNQISDDYLIELSYIYYALYNDTLNVYQDMKRKYDKIYYYMLNEEFYNNINNNKAIDWEIYSEDARETLSFSYKYNLENELFSILDINPNFCIPEIEYVGWGMPESYKKLVNRENFFKEGWFKDLFDLVGAEVMANSDLKTLTFALDDENLDYTKQLVATNPNIFFNYDFIFNSSDKDKVKNFFNINQIAFFNEDNKESIKIIVNKYTDYFSDKLLKYYSQILQNDSNFKFYNNTAEIQVLEFLITRKINLPASVYSHLNEEERNSLLQVINESKSIEVKYYKLYRLSKTLKIKYSEPKQKKLIKK